MLRTVVQLGKGCKGKLYNACTRVSNSTIFQTTSNYPIPSVIASNYETLYSFMKCDNRWSEGYERKRKARYDKWAYEVKHDWLDALGWSGVLLLGWYLCQPYCRKILKNPAERYAFEQLASNSTLQYSSIIQSLNKVLSLQSTARYVVPTVNASKKSGAPESNGKDYDEVLKDVCNKLEEAHAKVNSSLQNFLGTECMQLGKYDEAFLHFSQAAESDHSSAYFNLGICHEMGFGTNQSFGKAAEFYRKAAELGHATAMYNLGVFYVHGWGGITCDEKEAERLFMVAANLGQKDAMWALNLESKDDCVSGSVLSDQLSDSVEYNICDSVELQNNTLTDIWYKVMNIKFDQSNAEHDNSISSDSGINELSPSAELKFFPSMVGHESLCK